MEQREHERTGGITPHITIRDRRAADAVDWYKKAFGAEELMRHPTDDGRLMHASLKINNGFLMLNDDFPEHMGGPSQAPDAGAEVRFPLADQFWGDRYGQVTDPFGFIWSIGAPVKQDQQQNAAQPATV